MIAILKAIDHMHCRAPHTAENRDIPVRNGAGGWLTGMIYCAECGERLTINHSKKGCMVHRQESGNIAGRSAKEAFEKAKQE